jgi:hypothetical protein
MLRREAHLDNMLLYLKTRHRSVAADDAEAGKQRVPLSVEAIIQNTAVRCDLDNFGLTGARCIIYASIGGVLNLGFWAAVFALGTDRLP